MGGPDPSRSHPFLFPSLDRVSGLSDRRYLPRTVSKTRLFVCFGQEEPDCRSRRVGQEETGEVEDDLVTLGPLLQLLW